MFGGVGFPPPDVFIIGDRGALYTPSVPLIALAHYIFTLTPADVMYIAPLYFHQHILE